MIVWVDCETTGLEPNEGLLLEVGLAITDDDLHMQHSCVVAIHQQASWERFLEPICRKIHTESGLIREINLWNQELHTRPVAEDSLMDWLADHGVRAADKHPMAGSSVQFDRLWLNRWMPHLHNYFGYRNIDVSSIYEVVKRWYPDLILPEKRKLHRPIPDIEDSIRLLKFMRDSVFQ